LREREAKSTFTLAMPNAANPALNAFVAEIGSEMLWAELLIERAGNGWMLRNKTDRGTPAESLRILTLATLRRFVLFNKAGHFRPLSGSPDLPAGWVLRCGDDQELWLAMQQIYPGSIADWWAARAETSHVTNYREFTNRQSGMYRITQLPSDQQAADLIRAGCAAAYCLKRRLWSIQGLPADTPGGKSQIPCLEPCSILLEFARKSVRIGQEETVELNLSKSDLQSVISSIEALAANSPLGPGGPAGNMASELNPRRLQLLLVKIRARVERSGETPGEE
jgi:hypothetical protein